MTNEATPDQATISEEDRAPREWVTPTLHRLIAAGAESGGDTSSDGSASLS